MSTPIPIRRPRRLRINNAIRNLVRETRLDADDLIQPMFIVPGSGIRKPVASMPGVCQVSVDQAVEDARKAMALGVGGVILFGIPASKDALGSDAWSEVGIVQQAIRAMRNALPDMAILADTCLCEYTDHGHCGPVRGGGIANDETLELLGRTAIAQARAGADIVAPSGMMDGMVAAIREALDSEGFERVSILSYAVKYASAYYGPFRDAAENTPSFGDRRSYQMDPANRREAMTEAQLDIDEGADMLMVKPGLAYMDILGALRQTTDLPLAIYSVSGEYAMIKAAAERGWIDEQRVVMETLTGFKRAGADLILTYHATQAAAWLTTAK
ncbi:MAG: porphobilinogen synthase [Magnetococcales bacterium]|nr:porphobilinogen synthase [Magnetococcales bacterium]MBF0148503.1 porphobilinogen synthase [Magnetococcales bacterium]MBF0173933.1 porphobilinogen synthase [Magnetococcales bacterium]MBF0347415.1 porphobilinogen synthase [Magnetococcales bacterium]MBF0630651.1 porphobilinogen synthase [Magnetococcales bacterium]